MLQKIKDIFAAIKISRDQKLFRQWMEHYDLPPREIKAELPKTRKGNLYQQWINEGSLAPENMPVNTATGSDKQKVDVVLSHRLIRYIIIEAGVIVALLVALAVVTTLLVMKPG